MTIESLADALQGEHREIDRSLEEYAAGGSLDSLSRAICALRRHIYLEEEFLFPPLRAGGLMAPVFVMLREHGQMWLTLDELEAGLTGDVDRAAIDELCRTLSVLEQHHNPKEEQILYPQADHILDAPASGQLRELLTCGELPDGWVCERARVTTP